MRLTENFKTLFIVTILVIFSLSVTYAFVNLSASDSSVIGTGGCFSVNYVGQSIDNSSLISTTTYTEGASSEVTLSKNANCAIYTEAKIKLHTNSDITAPIAGDKQALKYKVVKTSGDGAIISGGEGVINQTGDITLATVTLTEISTIYTIYIWIDSTISSGTYNGTTYSGYIFAETVQTSTIKPDYALLNTAPVGSFVSYVGDNGCPEAHCDGTNANYVDSTDMGYCYNSSDKFSSSGWRILSIDDGGVYLVSAGAPECMGTLSDGTSCNDSSGTCASRIESYDSMYMHYDNMDEIANSYCNIAYAKNGVCDETTAWAMKDEDYQKILGKELSSCYATASEECGLNNNLIDNGGWYWFATMRSSGISTYVWYASNHGVGNASSNIVSGVRPVIYIDPEVVITSGSGTYENPYQISNL